MNILTDESIQKVGYSLKSCKTSLKRYYKCNPEIIKEFKNFFSIEDKLYSGKSCQNLDLCAMTHRIYGKLIIKLSEIKTFLRSPTRDQLQYSILHALLPLVMSKIYFGKLARNKSLLKGGLFEIC